MYIYIDRVIVNILQLTVKYKNQEDILRFKMIM